MLGGIALVPWLLVLDASPSPAASLRSAWAMSVAFVAAVFAWFGLAIGDYTGVGGAAGLLVMLLAAPVLQLQVLAFALARHLAARRHGPVPRALAGAAAWVGAEWLLPKLLGDTLGHGLYPSSAIRQVAELGGAAALTVLVLLVNEAIALAITHRDAGRAAMFRPLGMALLLVAGAWSFGALRLQQLQPGSPPPGAPTLRVGMVQSNLYDYERMRREIGAYAVVRQVLDTHYALSREAIDQHGVDALLWSETVYPTTFGSPKSADGAGLDRELRDFVTAAGVPLVFGTYDRDAGGEYNAAAFVEPGTGLLGFYRKARPFPLTEQVPTWLDGPMLRRWLPWAGTWKAGDGARVLPIRTADGREVPVLPLICRDDVDTRLAIEGARLGAQAIVAMSNDSWFTAHPRGARLHLAVAAFRSIETRLPQLRVTANGLSAQIDATGAVVASTAMGTQAVLVGTLVLADPPRTLMLAWGDWVGAAGLAFLLVLVVSGLAASWRRSERAGAAAGSTDPPSREVVADGVVLSPPWRLAAGVLRLCAGGGLLWTAAAALSGDPARANALAQATGFGVLVLMPLVAAWAIRRAFRARVRVADGRLLLDTPEGEARIDAADIAGVDPWMLPLPEPGLRLRRTGGGHWPQGVAGVDPVALVTALETAGAPMAFATLPRVPRAALAYAQARIAVGRSRVDHPALKFVLFPLVPALPAFRLHQHIAYGGTFGEYYTYGLQAYLTAFGLWWASWAIGMVLVAAALRVLVEAGTLLAATLRPQAAIGLRTTLERVARWLFYLGVPCVLVARILLG
jgi:apolipoprotein N-acyltransferase